MADAQHAHLKQRIAALNRDLNYPGAARLQRALAKEGIRARVEDIRENVTSTQGARQVLQPPPKYEGKIASSRLDDRWVADMISFVANPAKDDGTTWVHVLLVQDIFSRKLFAERLRSTPEATSAFERILDRTGRKPRELNTDKDSVFMSQEFQTMLRGRGVEHRTKEALNDIATIDAAIREVRSALGRRTLQPDGGNWAQELDAVIAGYNRSDHSALMQSEPNEVAGNDQLRFALRYDNAQKMEHNFDRMTKRQENLQRAGGYRTLLNPLSFRRRAGQPNWSQQVHTIQSMEGTRVTDDAGAVAQTKLVQPVPTDSTEVAYRPYMTGGSAQVDDRRRAAMSRFVAKLKTELGATAGKKMPTTTASRIMNDDASFRIELRAQRMTFMQFVKLFPREFLIRRRADHKTVIALADTDRNFQRLRRLPGAMDSSLDPTDPLSLDAPRSLDPIAPLSLTMEERLAPIAPLSLEERFAALERQQALSDERMDQLDSH